MIATVLKKQHSSHNQCSYAAFTLIELSIVLVIIGLLTGGILAGKNLLHAAELRAIVTELETYKTATEIFQDTYGGFPGDLPNATDIWGALDGGDGLGADCTSLAATDKRTCNGDGSNTISATTRNEYYRYWQHLANAGLISGQYTGVHGSGGENHHVPGENCPTSRYKTAGWSIPHFTFYAGDTRLWARTEELGHTLTLGGGTATTFTYEPLFTVADAYGMDAKLDDGKPGLGMVQIMYWPECSTVIAADQYETAEYQLSNENDSQCGLIFPNAINP